MSNTQLKQLIADEPQRTQDEIVRISNTYAKSKRCTAPCIAGPSPPGRRVPNPDAQPRPAGALEFQI